jgi:hypothetical protein
MVVMTTSQDEAPARQANHTVRARMMRTAIGTIVVLVVAGAVAATAAQMLLDESLLKRELSARLGRTVDYENLTPGLFSFSIENLVVGDTQGFDASPLLEVGEMNLGYSIFSLFRGKLLITEAELSGGKIGVEFDTGWVPNIADLIAPSDKPGLLEIETIALEDMTIEMRSPEGAVSMAHLNGRLANLRSAPFLFELDGEVFERPFTTRGRYDSGRSALEVALTTDSLPLAGLPIPRDVFDAAGLAVDLDFVITQQGDSAHVKGKANLRGMGELETDVNLEWSGPLEARGLLALTTNATALRRIAALRQPLDELQAAGGIRAAVRFDGPLDKLPNTATGTFLDFSVRPEGFRSRLEHLRGDFLATPSLFTLRGVTLGAEGQKLAANGTITLPGKTLNLTLTGDPVDLGVLVGLVDASVLPAGVTLHGRGAVNLAIKGVQPNLTTSGTVRFDGARLTTREPRSEISAIRGTVKLSPSEISFPSLDGRFGSSNFHAAGAYNPKKERFSATLSAKGKASFDGKLSGSLDAPRIEGDFGSQALTLFGITIRDLAANLIYDGDRIAIKGFEAKTLGGLIAGNASAGLSDRSLPFEAAITATSLDLPETLKTLANFAGAAAGTMAARLNVRGNGTDEASYGGDGEVSVKNASFGGLAAVTRLAPFLGLTADQVGTFSGGTMRFSVRDGAIHIRDALKLENDHIALSAGGTIGLLGSLGLVVKADVPTQSTLRGIAGHPLGQILGVRSAGDRTTIPFRVGGTLGAPQFALDVKPEEAISNLIQERMAESLNIGVGVDSTSPVSPRQQILRDVLDATRRSNEIDTGERDTATSSGNRAVDALRDLLRNRE